MQTWITIEGLPIGWAGQPMVAGIGKEIIFRVPPYLGVSSVGVAGSVGVVVGAGGGDSAGVGSGVVAGLLQLPKTRPIVRTMMSGIKNSLFIVCASISYHLIDIK
jgi:hypothetical protein